MKLGTIGAVLSFALEREKSTIAFLDDVLQRKPSQTEELTAVRIIKAKHLRAIEQLRRESVTEMILEPIEGLDSDDFPPAVRPPAGVASDYQRLLVAAEKDVARYLTDAVPKVTQKDIARMLKKIAQEKEELVKSLQGLVPPAQP